MGIFLAVKNQAQSTLNGAINDVVTSLVVATGEGANFPTNAQCPFHISIDNEILNVTARSTDTMTVARGAESTTPASHSNGAILSLNVTAAIISELQEASGGIAVEISSAEILALFTTPKTLVAAPGAGKVLEFVSLLLALDYNTTAYTVGTATDLQVKYTNASGVAVSTTRAVTGFLDQTTDTIFLLDRLEATIAPAINAALVLCLAVANPTLGNSPIHAKVVYRVYETGL